MDEWFKWFGSMFWQRSHDERVEKVQAEVAAISADVRALKERTAALEAFHQLAEETQP